MNDLERVQICDSLQHLPDDVAGVLLRVVALVQDPVENLPARGPAGAESRLRWPHGTAPTRRPTPCLQLQEDEVLLACDVDVHQLQDVGVLHPVVPTGQWWQWVDGWELPTDSLGPTQEDPPHSPPLYPPGLGTHIFRMMISFLAAFRTLRPSRFKNFLQVYSFPDVFSFARKISQNSSLQGISKG